MKDERRRSGDAARRPAGSAAATLFGDEILNMQRAVLLDRLAHASIEPNPALMELARKRADSVQNRIADQITAFAGSMRFVYIHILWFASWIGFGVEGYPYGLLTMIVSLEAIFLSTFVMISQNRADAKRQVLADHQWQTVKEEDRQNQDLLDVSNQILELTKAIHDRTSRERGARHRGDQKDPMPP
jgi:uncharacterized membrane protein